MTGLTSVEVDRLLAKNSPNILPTKKPVSLSLIFFRQFKSPFIYVLFFAAIVSYFLGHQVNSIFVLVVLLLNAVIGTIQEYSAERAASSLKNMVPSFVIVIRDGKPQKINSINLVPGDLVQLAAGDKVPADVLLVESTDLHVDESMLTGESVPVHKHHNPVDNRTHNKCFAGTVVMRGRAKCKVIATGENTEIGRIATAIDVESVKPPLLQRIDRFTLRITYSIIILIFCIFIITVLRGDDIGTVFLLGVALAVSAIPEGLPAAITVALAIGMSRMAKNKVIIRKLVAVESLGSCTHIASDKTGTLTVNEMTVRYIQLANGNEYEVSGEGIDLHGQIVPITQSNSSKELKQFCISSVLANEASIGQKEDGLDVYGDMVDLAFLVMANKNNLDHEKIRKLYPEVASIPYESELGFAASVNRKEGRLTLNVKGSVEKILSLCSSSINSDEIFNPEKLKKQAEKLAAKGYRVLAVAVGDLDELPKDINTVLENLTFIGMVGMIDPLRPEIKQSIAKCKIARINVSMITGDHPQTAMALALEAGIADHSMHPVTGNQIMEAAKKGEEFVDDLILSTKVFARISPTQKKQIIKALIKAGEIVAVTGDGVNDAPALSHAHVGVSMGLRGTDVARENSDIILTDDRFDSIVQGIKQGRIVYNNIRKVIFLLISTGAAEIILILLSLLFGTPLPLLPIQLLWLNLVTNGIQDVALAFEPEEGDELKQPPRKPDEAIFNRLMLERVFINAIFMGCMAYCIFSYQIGLGSSVEQARNITLLLMVLFENVHVINSRSEKISVFRQYFFGNKFLIFGMLGAQTIHIISMYTPGLQSILQLQPVTLELWFKLLGVALILIIVDGLHKWLMSST